MKDFRNNFLVPITISIIITISLQYLLWASKMEKKLDEMSYIMSSMTDSFSRRNSELSDQIDKISDDMRDIEHMLHQKFPPF